MLRDYKLSILPLSSVAQSANQKALASIGATIKKQIDIWFRTLDALFQCDQRQQVELQSREAALDVVHPRHEASANNLEERLYRSLGMVDDKQALHLALM